MTIDPQVAAILLIELIRMIKAAKNINIPISDFERAAHDENERRRILDKLIQQS